MTCVLCKERMATQLATDKLGVMVPPAALCGPCAGRWKRRTASKNRFVWTKL